MDVVLEPERLEEGVDPLRLPTQADQIDVGVVTLARIGEFAVRAHRETAEEAQDECRGARSSMMRLASSTMSRRASSIPGVGSVSMAGLSPSHGHQKRGQGGAQDGS